MSVSSKVTTRGAAKSISDAPESATLQSIDDKLNSILTILEKNTNDIAEIKKEQREMCTSIEHCHVEIGDIKSLVANQDRKITACEEELKVVKEENCKMSTELKKLRIEMQNLEQYSHRNNLIIYGVPEVENENIYNVMSRMAEVLQFPSWSTSLLDAVHRMGKINKSIPRPIIMKFVSRINKEEFLRKRKAWRHLKASDLGYSSENSIYVNESLTSANRELMKETRLAAKVKKYNQVWTANCSIFVRRNKDTPALRIATIDDLERM